MPSIGIILCAEKNHVEVDYALKDLHKPIQVAEYRLTKELPPELQGKLPQPEDLAEEIRQELAHEDATSPRRAEDAAFDAAMEESFKDLDDLYRKLADS